MEFGNIPENIREDYEGFWQEVVNLHAYWDSYCQLYADKDAVNLLNRCAPGYFALSQRAWDDYIILQIGKLTDPAKTGKDRANLSFRRLINNIDQIAYPNLRQELEASWTTLEALSDAARKNRNRRIAHLDLSTYHNRHPDPLPAVDKKNIEDILFEMRKIIQSIEAHFNDAHIQIERPPLMGDAKALLIHLNDSESSNARRTEARKRLPNQIP